ncbi:MAG: hypothetical protein FRX49_10124 [Trebouxia sp. A1-2]|nr:MAG: hypothetical protein FRX49_10124 [Trebouxia sp. A1-2]
MWARAIGVCKRVCSPPELSVRLASGLSGTAPTTELRLKGAFSAGALCSTDPSARERLKRALGAGALACSAELAGVMLERALRAGVLGRTNLLELFLSVLQLLSALHVLVPALHHLTPQRCGLLVELQLTPLQPLDRLALLTLALVQCSSKLQYALHQQL